MYIAFTKILPYDLHRTSFDYVCSVLNQSVDPPSIASNQLRLQTDIIYHSTLERSKGCIQYEQDKVYRPRLELNEVAFALANSCTEQEWLSLGSKKVREVFLDKFFYDSLVFSRATLFSQVRELLRDALSSADSITLVSHSFRMKIFEAYIFTQGRIVDQPSLIRNYISTDSKTFEFGQGFVVKESELHFLNEHFTI